MKSNIKQFISGLPSLWRGRGRLLMLGLATLALASCGDVADEITSIIYGRNFSPTNPLPADSDRGRKYNPVLDKLQALTDEMKAIGEKYGASCSQIGIAWAIAKGTMPIVGATKERHVVEAAAAAADIVLTKDEVARLETLADATGIDTRGDWEHTME